MKNSCKLLFLFPLLLSFKGVQLQEYLKMIDAETYSVDGIFKAANTGNLNSTSYTHLYKVLGII
jgi:hypothetical protein